MRLMEFNKLIDWVYLKSWTGKVKAKVEGLETQNVNKYFPLKVQKSFLSSLG
jgi:hypothetical protein